MSINEVNEFESINQKTGERKFIAETEGKCKQTLGQVIKKRKAKAAIVRMLVTMVALVAALVGVKALEMIGWVNDIFCCVLMCMAGSMAMFKAGYLWREIKR